MVDTIKKATRLFRADSALIPTGNDFLANGYWGGDILDSQFQALGLIPDKLVLPKNYQAIIKLCYDYHRRGGMVSKVIDRLTELTITPIRNGQRKTTDEANAYFEAILHRKPSRLIRFLRNATLEYYMSGMVLPKIDWIQMKGSDISPTLTAGKMYTVPVFDLFPPQLILLQWTGWGKRTIWLKVADKDIALIRSQGGLVKDQQLLYRQWADLYPDYVSVIQSGADKIDITDKTDPILRKEVSYTPYPTPYMYNILEPLMYKDQLRRMDYAIASRVINAILLVQVGSDTFPVTEENQDIVDNLKHQLLARTGRPEQMERLFTLFADHTTKLTWIHPDVTALLNQEKYRQVNSELDEGLGFARILLTGTTTAGSGGQASEVSTWAIQPQMEELREMFIEWMLESVYEVASDLNKFRSSPDPEFKPIKLQDFVKTAAVYAQLFKEGNISRTTRVDMSGLDFDTEIENMKDEGPKMKGLPAFQPTPYSPPPPVVGQSGRPIGSQNVPINNRNSGVKPSGQAPTSRVKAEASLISDDEFIRQLDILAQKQGVYITVEDVLPKDV